MTASDHWRSSDKYGHIMGWYTRDCNEWLDSLDLEGKRVFEYGAGASSIWWRSRGCVVEGVDDQNEWADLAGVNFETSELHYLETILNYPKFDIVVIDGSFRDDCIDYALECLNEGGFIIIDNWKQGSAGWADWPNTEDIIKKLKLKTTIYSEKLHPDWKTLVIER